MFIPGAILIRSWPVLEFRGPPICADEHGVFTFKEPIGIGKQFKIDGNKCWIEGQNLYLPPVKKLVKNLQQVYK